MTPTFVPLCRVCGRPIEPRRSDGNMNVVRPWMHTGGAAPEDDPAVTPHAAEPSAAKAIQ